MTGSSSATVSAGPMPGSTPTAVPSVVPASPHSRLAGVSATANPVEQLAHQKKGPGSDHAESAREQQEERDAKRPRRR